MTNNIFDDKDISNVVIDEKAVDSIIVNSDNSILYEIPKLWILTDKNYYELGDTITGTIECTRNGKTESARITYSSIRTVHYDSYYSFDDINDFIKAEITVNPSISLYIYYLSDYQMEFQVDNGYLYVFVTDNDMQNTEVDVELEYTYVANQKVILMNENGNLVLYYGNESYNFGSFTQLDFDSYCNMDITKIIHNESMNSSGIFNISELVTEVPVSLPVTWVRDGDNSISDEIQVRQGFYDKPTSNNIPYNNTGLLKTYENNYYSLDITNVWRYMYKDIVPKKLSGYNEVSALVQFLKRSSSRGYYAMLSVNVGDYWYGLRINNINNTSTKKVAIVRQEYIDDTRTSLTSDYTASLFSKDVWYKLTLIMKKSYLYVKVYNSTGTTELASLSTEVPLSDKEFIKGISIGGNSDMRVKEISISPLGKYISQTSLARNYVTITYHKSGDYYLVILTNFLPSNYNGNQVLHYSVMNPDGLGVDGSDTLENIRTGLRFLQSTNTISFNDAYMDIEIEPYFDENTNRYYKGVSYHINLDNASSLSVGSSVNLQVSQLRDWKMGSWES